MKYGKGKCVECGRSVMTTDDGRAIAHPMPNGAGQCEGSAELTEQAARETAKPKPPPVVASNGSNGHSPHFKIEKGVPLPKRPGNGKPSRYAETLSQMAVGDSFVCPWKGRGSHSAVVTQAKKLGLKVATRRVDEGNVRVWRVK